MDGMPSATCPQGHPVGDGVKFCGVCGTAVDAAPTTCPQGHVVTPGQAYCESCGAPLGAGTGGPQSAIDTAGRETGYKKWILIGAVAALVAIVAGAAFVVVWARAVPEVTAENVGTLLKDGGIECEDINSVAAGQGTPEAELLQATIVACLFNDSSGEVDNTRSFGIFVADSPEALGKTLRVSGGCEGAEAEDEDLLVAYGPNWLAGGVSGSSSGAYIQEIATALGGEVSTDADVVARFCELE